MASLNIVYTLNIDEVLMTIKYWALWQGKGMTPAHQVKWWVHISPFDWQPPTHKTREVLQEKASSGDNVSSNKAAFSPEFH